jgi:hypothetical protein
MSAQTDSNAVLLTVLPNGLSSDGKKLRLTVLLTPSVTSATGTLKSPFDNWPKNLGTLSWKLTFQPLNTPVAPSTIPLPATPPAASFDQNTTPDGNPRDLDPNLWVAIFGTRRGVSPRTGNSIFSKQWRLSHDISTLRDRHENLRLFHAEKRLASAGKPQDAVQLNVLTSVQTLAAGKIAATEPPAIYIYPALGNDNGNFSNEIKARQAAKDFQTNTIETATNLVDLAKIKNRIKYALNILENTKKNPKALSAFRDDEKLNDAALFAVYLNCIQSVSSPGVSLETAPADTTSEDYKLYVLYQKTKSAYTGTQSLQVVGHYIALLLFHRREPHVDNPAATRPDFHQLLGMVNHYPSMLRVLGLVFDLVTDLPPDGYYLLSATPTENGAPNQLGTLTPIGNTTYCRYRAAVPAAGAQPAVPGNFFAIASDPNFIEERMLKLAAVDPVTNENLFTLISEDPDGTALKLTDQINNTARSTEYGSSAPTSMKKRTPYQAGATDTSTLTPAAVPDPTDAPPSSRTVGISLLARSRLIHLEGVVARAPEPANAGSSPTSFFADDLILGYRVDVEYKNTWFPLCARRSSYEVHDIDNLSTILYPKWVPSTPVELAADEGFIGFAASNSQVSDSGDSQTHVHQTVFTWSGWSLAVPQPCFPVFDPPPDATPPDTAKHLSIYPTFSLAAKEHVLPPLRFNQDYKFRCRVVDIAGNSVRLQTGDQGLNDVTGQPKTQFSRHEPIRAPQFLLTAPIDRIEHPGEHIDRMVARDYDSHSTRVLIAPRESLRLAELHGELTSPDLPPSAFRDFQLMDDGTFPDVKFAIDNGWADGRDDDNGNRDGIFLPLQSDAPTNPFYPDPLANFIRIDAFLVSEISDISRPLHAPFFIPINPDGVWPDRSPARVRLQPTDRSRKPSAKWEYVAMGPGFGTATIPELTVNVPYGQTVVLSICSTPVDPTANPKPAPVKVDLANLHEWFLKNAPPQFQDLATTLAGVGSDNLNANSFVDGSLDLVTPIRTMTLVHAVKQPLAPPDFAQIGSAGDILVQRDFGKPAAHVRASLEAHWLTTGQITCHAKWSDEVDDIKKSAPYRSNSHEIAFQITADQTVPPAQPDYDSSTYLRPLVDCIFHAFRDTRAHTVTYSLVAATRFRNYYPQAKSDSDFQIVGKTSRQLTVLSSVRPPAPSIAYIIPAFEWRDTYDAKSKTWFSGRDAVLRVYLNRPFRVSGDQEGIGVVLASNANPTPSAEQSLVSRWGSDPTRKIVYQISAAELTAANFCKAEDAVHTCILSEIVGTGGVNLADIKPYAVAYAEDRQMWYADIPVDTAGAYAPFMRLALVRWQPQALHDDTDDARISQVVFADFIQLSPDRWVSIERRDSRHYTVTVSGVFVPPDTPGCNPADKTFTCDLFSRWYALGKDMGWRPVKLDLTFCYTPAPAGSSISSWSAELELPHSTSVHKYRILLSEREWFPGNPVGRLIYEQFVDLS